MHIIETPIFTKQLLALLADEEYRLLQLSLLKRPDSGKIIPGGGGEQLKQLKKIVEEEYHEG